MGVGAIAVVWKTRGRAGTPSVGHGQHPPSWAYMSASFQRPVSKTSKSHRRGLCSHSRGRFARFARNPVHGLPSGWKVIRASPGSTPSAVARTFTGPLLPSIDRRMSIALPWTAPLRMDCRTDFQSVPDRADGLEIRPTSLFPDSRQYVPQRRSSVPEARFQVDGEGMSEREGNPLEPEVLRGSGSA